MPPALTTSAQRERLLTPRRVDVALAVRFTRDLAALPAEDFVRGFLVERLAVREVSRRLALRLRPGTRRRPRPARRLGSELGFRADGVEELLFAGEPISATRIRRAIGEGRVEEASQMLGRPYPSPA